jgi:hypothetical protein
MNWQTNSLVTNKKIPICRFRVLSIEPKSCRQGFYITKVKRLEATEENYPVHINSVIFPTVSSPAESINKPPVKKGGEKPKTITVDQPNKSEMI